MELDKWTKKNYLTVITHYFFTRRSFIPIFKNPDIYGFSAIFHSQPHLKIIESNYFSLL